MAEEQQEGSIAITEKTYLQDTYLFSIDEGVKVLKASLPAAAAAANDDGKKDADKACIILNRTLFHPQGGGQPSDQGIIEGLTTGNNAEIRFKVEIVRDINGVVYHYGSYLNDPALHFNPGDEVRMRVDEGIRRLNARLHSAGHAIDVAMSRAGHADCLKPTKGYHFPEEPYVEYLGSIRPEKKSGDALVEDLNHHLQALITEGVETQVNVVSKKEAADLLGGEDDVAHLPDGRDVRIVSVGGQACPCGGTHVKNTTDLGRIEVTKVKAKKNVVKLSEKL